MEKTPKPLKYNEIKDFLSERQLREHHDVLYAGYVKKWNEIQQKVKDAKLDEANGTFSMIRELKLEETFALNAIKLHEGYFDNMSSKSMSEGHQFAIPKEGSTIRKWIEQDFGSVEAWAEQFKALGLSARGWVVLAFDLDDGKLHNYLCDVHNQGGVWNCITLLILDVYEHAYFLDYATARKQYTEKFMSHIDWSVADEQISKFHLEKFRK